MRWGGSASKWRFSVVPTRILTTIVSHLVQGEARVDGPVNYVGGLRERKRGSTNPSLISSRIFPTT
jgi:hypothetical protein